MKTVATIKTVEPPYPFEAYTHTITPLPEEEGGGFLITFPDLPGCMADGTTIEETLKNGMDAFLGWICVCVDRQLPVPQPSSKTAHKRPQTSGKFVQRLPKMLHARLIEKAREEGVSLNTLVLTFIAEGLGRGQTGAGGQR